MTSEKHVRNHKVVTDAVHEHGGAIALQILHVGRYVLGLISFLIDLRCI
mgnify:CR=1 FL=1|jgi:2,4-dienoyl-CoA reductase (NADPH2)